MPRARQRLFISFFRAEFSALLAYVVFPSKREAGRRMRSEAA